MIEPKIMFVAFCVAFVISLVFLIKNWKNK